MNLLLKKATALVNTLLLFLLIFMLIVTACVLDHSKTFNTGKMVRDAKNWIQFHSLSWNLHEDTQRNISIIKIKKQVLLHFSSISQFPELPRGCEVTSLGMLLHSAGIKVDKLTLANDIKKEQVKKTVIHGQIFFGNPNEGFVGSIENRNEPGLGVYHKPIADLANKYLPGRVKDLTGSDFQDLKIHLSDGRPIWVITNTTYKKLPNNLFQTWMTPTGTVKVTYKEHSVLLTGYDQQFIYFNDPLTGMENKKAPIKDFEESWVQMGRQAITYLP